MELYSEIDRLSGLIDLFDTIEIPTHATQVPPLSQQLLTEQLRVDSSPVRVCSMCVCSVHWHLVRPSGYQSYPEIIETTSCGLSAKKCSKSGAHSLDSPGERCPFFFDPRACSPGPESLGPYSPDWRYNQRIIQVVV